MGEDNFILDTMGHCGFCLSGSSASSRSSSNHCLQYLAQYLKLNLSHILPRIGPTTVPEHLSRNFERAKLKVTLCQECGHLNEKFLKLHRQREKIDMEMGFCTRLIQEKLMEAEKKGKAEDLLGVNSNPEDQRHLIDGLGYLGRLKVFRTEMIEKCSRKLSVSIPRVKLRHIKIKGAIKDKNKRKRNPNKAGSVKRRSKKEQAPVSNDDNNTSFVVVYPTTSTPEIKGLQEDSFNPQTGKYKCNACSAVLTSKQILQKHYESVHLKVRHKCTLCGKEFTQKGHYNIHHWNVHMGVKFNCNHCGRNFAHRHHLKRHQQNNSCRKNRGPSYTSEPTCHCPICGKGYTTKWYLKIHLKDVHYETRKHVCNICEKKFNRKSDSSSHQRQIHPSAAKK